MPQKYRYHPLPNERSVRLIKLHRGGPSRHGFYLSLLVADLNDAPPFFALSYTWGPALLSDGQNSSPGTNRVYRVAVVDEMTGAETAKRGLKATFKALSRLSMIGSIGGMSSTRYIPVQGNLWDFLVRVATTDDFYDHHSTLLWIDAICIDQQNLAERAKQVTLMGEVYRAAARVVVWQGKTEPPATVTWILRSFAPRFVSLASEKGTDYLAQRNVECMDEDLVSTLGEETCALWRDAWLHWLIFVGDLAWFTRGWVVQETAVKRPTQIILLIGPHLFDWDLMQDFAFFLKRSRWFDQLLNLITVRDLDVNAGELFYRHHRLEMSSTIRTMLLSMEGHERSKAVTNQERVLFGAHTRSQVWWAGVFGVIAMLRERSFGDHRDHVFASLGMMSSCMPAGMRGPPAADYTLSVEHVFTRFTAQLIESLPILFSLSAVQSNVQTHYPSLPSWVPDYSVTGIAALMQTRLGDSSVPCFDASDSDAREWPKPTFDLNGTILTLYGACFDVVVDPGSNFYRKSYLEDVIDSCICADIYDPTGQPQAEAVCRTLIGDSWLVSSPSSVLSQIFKRFFGLYMAQSLTLLSGDSATPRTEALLDRLSWAETSEAHRDWLPTASQVLEHMQKPLSTIRPLLVKERFDRQFRLGNTGRVFFRSSRGFPGLGPLRLATGDEIWAVGRAKVPLVLRKTEGGNYRLVGECYLHGFMHGGMMTPELVKRMAPVKLI